MDKLHKEYVDIAISNGFDEEPYATSESYALYYRPRDGRRVPILIELSSATKRYLEALEKEITT